MSTIKSIVKKRITNETLWNLAVEGDESYIANGVAVHNCRSVLVPITKYEEWSSDAVTNSGENLDRFLEENVSDAGFAVYVNEVGSEKEKRPEITDPNVEIKVDSSGRVDTTTYSMNGKSFQMTTIVYEDDKKTKIKSVEHKRLDE